MGIPFDFLFHWNQQNMSQFIFRRLEPFIYELHSIWQVEFYATESVAVPAKRLKKGPDLALFFPVPVCRVATVNMTLPCLWLYLRAEWSQGTHHLALPVAVPACRVATGDTPPCRACCCTCVQSGYMGHDPAVPVAVPACKVATGDTTLPCLLVARHRTDAACTSARYLVN